MEELEQREGSRLQQLIGIAVTVLLVLAVILCAYAAVQVLSNGYVSIGGYMLFRVVTGSMEPTIPVGALMVTRQVDFDSVALQDIICFRTQETAIWGKIVTHRVVGMISQPDGSILLETKGDANLVADIYRVSQDNFIGKVIWHTGDDSALASIFSFLTSRIGFLGCIVFPCLLLAGLVMRECVSGIRSDLQAYMAEMERAEASAPQPETPYGLTRQEYDEMVARIRAELMEELKQYAEILRAELEKTE